MRKKLNPGDPISNLTAADYNDIVSGIESRRNLEVVPPLVRFASEPDIIGISWPIGFYAKLSGSSSPYSFTEQHGTSGGAWSNSVRTGTTNAYEVNGTASLNNKVVWLEPGFPGDYRFQYLGAGTGGPIYTTCSPCDIPQVAFTLSFYYYDNTLMIVGPISVTLIYAAGVWSTGILATPADSNPESIDGHYYKINMSCSGGNTLLSCSLYQDSGGATPSGFAWTQPTISAATCSPYELTLGASGGPVLGFFASGTLTE